MLTPTQTTAIHIVATSLYALLLGIALLLCYFTIIAISGSPGGLVIDIIKVALPKQQTALAAIGPIVTAIPALALALANTKKGSLTKRGKIYLAILVPTYVVSTVTHLLLDPNSTDLGASTTPALAHGMAVRVSAFALTYMAAILGLRQLSAQPDESASGGKKK